VTLRRGAIVCDFDGCWSALVVSNPIEMLTPPVGDIIQHRAWVKGWWTDDEERDFCGRHPRTRHEPQR
jgi:hypothetical protein